MTETDWLKAKDPDEMVRLVAGRLSPRQWHLLACSLARRAWEMIPEGDLRAALEWCEQNAGKVHQHRSRGKWAARRDAAQASAGEVARAAQHAIVRMADPDADPDSFVHTDERKVNAAVPLFQAASRYAGLSVEQAGEAALHAAGVVALLTELPPGEDQLEGVRRCVVEAGRIRTAASLHAAAALKLMAAGDTAADLDNGKNVNVRYAASLEKVTKEEESLAVKVGDLEEAKQRSDRKATARYLLDLAGNPFKPFRLLPEWRTEAVVALATAIDEGRSYDKMPALADALLDADCDEEAVLRHCRGTEAHAPDGPAHTRGCWVIDLILNREPAYVAAPPLVPPPPPPPPSARPPAGRAPSSGMDRLLRALQAADDDDDDDDKPPTL